MKAKAIRELLNMAYKSEGYLEGYDDAINDVLQWLRTENAGLAERLVADIQEHNKSKQRPIKVG